MPKETFVYDEMYGPDLEKTFDKVSFYNEMDMGITLDDFMALKPL